MEVGFLFSKVEANAKEVSKEGVMIPLGAAISVQ